MDYDIQEEGRFKYIETRGSGEVVILIPGLFEGLSRFNTILDRFGSEYNIIVPVLPLFELPIRELSINSLVDYVAAFVESKGWSHFHLLGHSLGGQIALLYTLANGDLVRSLTLVGSSGLVDNALGSVLPGKDDFDAVRKQAESMFFNLPFAEQKLTEEFLSIAGNRNKSIRVVATAKSASRQHLADKLHQVRVPTLLVWGKKDVIIPPFVGEKYQELIEGAQLVVMDNCGHAPIMEQSEQFNLVFGNFLFDTIRKHEQIASTA